MEVVNSALQAGVTFPGIMGLDFSKLDLDWNAGYINIGGTITPGFWEYVAYGLSALKKEIKLIRNVQANPEKFDKLWDDGPMPTIYDYEFPILSPKFLQ